MASFFTVAFRHEAEKEFGERRVTDLAIRAAASVRRQLQAIPLQQQHAFPHISEHFREVPGKPAHGIFLPEYRDPQELSKLILRAIDAPGIAPMLSKSDDGDWAAVLQTWFGAKHPIGYCGITPVRHDLCHLCVIADLNGDLITAYPCDRYRMAGNTV